jgi:hypothetical protein
MIKMEDEMAGAGLRNVYTISMENLKGNPPLLGRCRQSLERNIAIYLSEIVYEGIDWTHIKVGSSSHCSKQAEQIVCFQ